MATRPIIPIAESGEPRNLEADLTAIPASDAVDETIRSTFGLLSSNPPLEASPQMQGFAILSNVPPSGWSKELLEKAIRENPHVIRLINKDNTENYMEYYRMACAIDGTAIAEIPEEERTVELLEIAVNEDSSAIKYISKYYSIDDVPKLKEIILLALSRNPGLYHEMPFVGHLLNQDADVLESALNDMSNYLYLVSNPNTPRDIVATIIKRCPEYYLGLPWDSPYLSDTEIMAFAFEDPDNIPLVLFNIHAPEELIEKALLQDPANIRHVNPKELYNPRWADYVANDPKLHYLLEPPISDLPHGGETLTRFDSDLDYSSMLKSRLDLELRIVANPENPSHPSEPVALFIYCKDDHNGAFNINAIHKLQEQGFAVAYYEVENEEEFISVMNSYLPMLRENDTVFVGGHGWKNGLILHDTGDEKGNIDTGDKQQLISAFPEQYISYGVKLILNACSNAAGGAQADNMLNSMFDVFRGRWHVYAVTEPSQSYYEVHFHGFAGIRQWKGDSYHIWPGGAVEICDTDGSCEPTNPTS